MVIHTWWIICGIPFLAVRQSELIPLLFCFDLNSLPIQLTITLSQEQFGQKNTLDNWSRAIHKNKLLH